MIGQKKLLGTFKDLIDADKLPRFIILKGQKGSGKKLLADWISLNMKGTTHTYNLPDVKVDTIRDMITQAYKVNATTVYIIPDADNMSLAAKNAILKITEEPPNNAYFVLTLEDDSKMLDTIKSRGYMFMMDRYSPTEVVEYASTKKQLLPDEIEIIADLCETPGEADTLMGMHIIEFYDYVVSVVDNIAEVSGANAFKIADKLQFKDEVDKYDLKLFWKAFMKICISKAQDNRLSMYITGVTITSKYLQELYITGINKQSTFDMWLLDIRESWINWE